MRGRLWRAGIAVGLAFAGGSAFALLACSAPNDRPPPTPGLDLGHHFDASALDAGDDASGDAATASNGPTACTGTGNVAVLNGDDVDGMRDFIHPGYASFADGTWAAEPAIFDGGLQEVKVLLNRPTGDLWTFEFGTDKLHQPLTPGDYVDAQRAPFAEEGHPGLQVYGNGRGCNTLTGRYHVSDLALDDAGAVARFSADFEQHCEGAQATLRGCVKYAR